MGRKELLATVGLGIISISTSIYILRYALWSEKSGTPVQFQTGSEAVTGSSETTKVPASGKDGPAWITRTSIEEWSWQVPKRIVSGESATVTVRCRLKKEKRLVTGPMDAQTGDDSHSRIDS